MAKQDDWVRITLRLPRDVHERLTGVLDDTNRSMNAEIVARLESSFLPIEAQGLSAQFSERDLQRITSHLQDYLMLMRKMNEVSRKQLDILGAKKRSTDED